MLRYGWVTLFAFACLWAGWPKEAAASAPVAQAAATRTRDPLDPENLYADLRHGGWVKFFNWKLRAGRVEDRKLFQLEIEELDPKNGRWAALRVDEGQIQIDPKKRLLLLQVKNSIFESKQGKLRLVCCDLKIPIRIGSKGKIVSLLDDPTVACFCGFAY